MLKVVKYSPSIYVSKQKKYNLKQLGHKIREGVNVIATDGDGLDITKDMLIDIVFTPFLSYRHPKSEELKSHFLYLFDQNKLEEIIENGGLEEYTSRKNKGFIN